MAVTPTDDAPAASGALSGELRDALIVEFPLRGEWAAYHTPASRIPSHGTDQLGQRFAFDLLRVDARPGWSDHPAGSLRRTLVGVPTRECYGWGEPVHSPFDATVVAAVDGVREPGWVHPVRGLATVLKNAVTFDPSGPIEAVVGNYVVLQHGDVYALFAHLATGSVAVTPGASVARGEVIGRVGHTGNSTAPHLHFQLMDGPNAISARGVPVAFAAYEVKRNGGWERVEHSIPTNTDRFRSSGSGS